VIAVTDVAPASALRSTRMSFGQVSLELSDARACIGETPTFTCDADGRPIVVGCEDDFTALYACLGI
jgi:hypothetical protein